MVPHGDSHFLPVIDNFDSPVAFFPRRSKWGIDQGDKGFPGISEPVEVASERVLWNS
jgi:hypothetical protein